MTKVQHSTASTDVCKQAKYPMMTRWAETCCKRSRTYGVSIFPVVVTEQNKEMSYTKCDAKI